MKNNFAEPILLYQFKYAPQELKEYSTMGGDEDWIICIPQDQFEHEADFLQWKFDDEYNSFFGYKQCTQTLSEFNGKQYYILIYGH